MHHLKKLKLTKELIIIEDLFFKINQHKIQNLTIDSECEAYSGYNFTINNLNFKYRKSKITPKKTGQFVSLWKRNSIKQTEPFSDLDNFDFYIVASEHDKQFGFFIFPKNILLEKNILSSPSKEGKRGFRLYPTWVKAENKQAKKTQFWQSYFFINVANNESQNSNALKQIITFSGYNT